MLARTDIGCQKYFENFPSDVLGEVAEEETGSSVAFLRLFASRRCCSASGTRYPSAPRFQWRAGLLFWLIGDASRTKHKGRLFGSLPLYRLVNRYRYGSGMTTMLLLANVSVPALVLYLAVKV